MVCAVHDLEYVSAHNLDDQSDTYNKDQTAMICHKVQHNQSLDSLVAGLHTQTICWAVEEAIQDHQSRRALISCVGSCRILSTCNTLFAQENAIYNY